MKRVLITLWILWRFLALVFFVERRARGWIVTDCESQSQILPDHRVCIIDNLILSVTQHL